MSERATVSELQARYLELFGQPSRSIIGTLPINAPETGFLTSILFCCTVSAVIP